LSEANEKLTVSIWRGDAEAGAFETFEAPAFENQTVLDVVAWVQQNAEPALAYRYACRVGMCGSCAMMVNGAPRWTCRTHVSTVVEDGALEIAPLRNFPVIRDLAVDMAPFFEKWTRAGGAHEGAADRFDPVASVAPSSAARVEADSGIECINCGVCYASCDTVAGSPDYLGPAALLRAWTIHNDSRQADPMRALRAVSGAGGCHNCHSQGGCTRHCPNGLDPLRGILGLKRATARAALKGAL
jgi:fumarate reductase iron-sulfur subunit